MRENFNLHGIKENKVYESIYKCVHCGYCLELCPARDASHFDIYGSRGKMLVFKALIEDKLEITQTFGDRILNCALCRWCTYKCPEEIPTDDVFITMRYEVAKRDLMPPIVKKVMNNILKKKNPYGLSTNEITRWASGLKFENNTETIFFASCMNTTMGYLDLIHKLGLPFDMLAKTMDILEKLKLDNLIIMGTRLLNLNKQYHQTLRNAVQLLQKINVKVGYLFNEEPCCGKPLHTYGYLTEFQEYAKHVNKLFKDKGVKKLVVVNPVCAYTFKILYPKFVEDFDVEVTHIVEVLDENLDKWTNIASYSKPITITYHDPCYMSRYMSLVEQPRRILKHIKNVVLVETERSEKNTYCTGDGGIEITHSRAAIKIAQKRVEMLLKTRAETIITACPACISMLRYGLKLVNGEKEVQIMDIVDFVHKAIS
ncbi:MAG: (Fe-S)-binding protein [Candidatus Aenigmarchaeota archaeon]|nr:(Fe-S)-binding protein [Candidatus Aenigmarchaeota archaeon]